MACFITALWALGFNDVLNTQALQPVLVYYVRFGAILRM